jgi:hypothetical protein
LGFRKRYRHRIIHEKKEKKLIAGTSNSHFAQHQTINNSTLQKFSKGAQKLIVSGIKTVIFVQRYECLLFMIFPTYASRLQSPKKPPF